MAEHEGEKGGIKVTDRRRFTAEGSIRDGAPTEDPKRPPPPPPAAKSESTKAAAAGERNSASNAPNSDFMAFISGYAAQALAALGLMPEAQARGIPVDYATARECIEIVAMLQDKTRGNLSREESASLQRLVGDLRTQYVQVTQSGSAAAGGKRLPRR